MRLCHEHKIRSSSCGQKHTHTVFELDTNRRWQTATWHTAWGWGWEPPVVRGVHEHSQRLWALPLLWCYVWLCNILSSGKTEREVCQMWKSNNSLYWIAMIYNKNLPLPHSRPRWLGFLLCGRPVLLVWAWCGAAWSHTESRQTSSSAKTEHFWSPRALVSQSNRNHQLNRTYELWIELWFGSIVTFYQYFTHQVVSRGASLVTLYLLFITEDNYLALTTI